MPGGLTPVEILNRLTNSRNKMLASMGPRTYARGNHSHYLFRGNTEFQASMGPRTHARGNPCRYLDRDLRLDASMGPRTYARGNSQPVTPCAASSRKAVCERHSRTRFSLLFQRVIGMLIPPQVVVTREHRAAAVIPASPRRSRPQDFKELGYTT